MLCSNSNKSLEKERKDAAKTGASQFEPALVSKDRERRSVTSREKEHSEGELPSANASFQRFTVKAIERLSFECMVKGVMSLHTS